MPNLHDIIQKIKNELHCPICGINYEHGEIKLRGLFNSTIILQTICQNNHSTVFMTSYQKPVEKSPVNMDDVLDLHNTLKDYNGDLEKLFKYS